jgi:hypothetical protein
LVKFNRKANKIVKLEKSWKDAFTSITMITEVFEITEMIIQTTTAELTKAISMGNTVDAAHLKAKIAESKAKIAEKKSEKRAVKKTLKAKISEIKNPKKASIHDITHKMIAHTKKVIASQKKRKDLQLDLEYKKQLLQKAKS